MRDLDCWAAVSWESNFLQSLLAPSWWEILSVRTAHCWPAEPVRCRNDKSFTWSSFCLSVQSSTHFVPRASFYRLYLTGRKYISFSIWRMKIFKPKLENFPPDFKNTESFFLGSPGEIPLPQHTFCILSSLASYPRNCKMLTIESGPEYPGQCSLARLNPNAAQPAHV